MPKYFGLVIRASGFKRIHEVKVEDKRRRARVPTRRSSDMIRLTIRKSFLECVRLARDRDQ